MKEPFKPQIARTYIGTYQPKIDGGEKASGNAKYLGDIAMKARFPRMLYAKVLRSPFPHARIKRVDTGRAESLPGVKAVITYDDSEAKSLKPTTNAWTSVNTVPYERMYFPTYRDRKVLSDHVRWVGDEAGVVVAAEREDIAEEALKMLDIEWEVLPFVLDPLEAMKPEAPVIHPEINPEGNILPSEPEFGPDVFVDEGNVEKGLEEADISIEVKAEYQNTEHACLDTRGCLMYWKGDSLTCLTNYYQADQTRMFISSMLEMPLHKIRVINPYVGGSFGRGNTGDQSFFIFTALLSKKAGRPVRFKHTRREDFHDTRNATIYTCKMGANRDGKIEALQFKAIANAGAYADHTMASIKFIPGFEIRECMLSHIPNLKMEAYAVYTNMIPASCMRGVGNNQFNMVLGLAVDVMAEKLSMDPLELTVNNFGHKWGKLPDKSLDGILKEGARRIGWAKRHKPGQGPVYYGAKKRGIGFSFHMGWHTAWQEIPRGHVQLGIRLNPDMSVILEAPMAETGTGSNTCAVLACAEGLSFLNVKPEDIHWISTVDTETGYKDMVQTDSAVSYLHAEIMPKAIEQLKLKILKMAAARLELPPDEMEFENGRVVARKAPDKNLTVKELLWEGDMVPILVTVNDTMPEEVTGIPFGATFAEVEVDIGTGQIKVLKLVVLNDLGTVMFATGAEAQQIGGQCMGLGETLMEEIVYDRATGIPLNFNWIDYLFPTMLDFPVIEPVPMEIWKGAGEYGACGLGEGVTTCTPRAITNAVYNAIGVRIDNIPLHPKKILNALSYTSQSSEVIR